MEKGGESANVEPAATRKKEMWGEGESRGEGKEVGMRPPRHENFRWGGQFKTKRTGRPSISSGDARGEDKQKRSR